MDPDTDLPDGQTASASSALTEVWSAVNDLAQVWAGLPVIQHFAAELPRNAPQRSTGIPGRLQEMEAGGGDISGHPLRLLPTIQLMQNSPMLIGQPLPPGWDSWLELARRAELAHRLTVAWLRSRMPGYPGLPAPQLAAGTPLTTDEFTDQLIWQPQERTHGFKFPDPPAQINSLLQITQQQQRETEDATRILADAIERTGQWSRLAAATRALTETGRADLRGAREELTRRLAKSQVDAHSQLARPRFNFRVTTLDEILGALSGSAYEYATAFTAANKITELAASDVFSELAIYGPPTTLSRPHDIDLRPGTFQLVSFTRAHTESSTRDLLEIGQIVWLGDVLVPDAVRLTGSTITVNQMGTMERWTGQILEETGSAWSPR